MKTVYFAALLLCFTFSIKASQLDSLLKRWENVNDSAKYDSLIMFARDCVIHSKGSGALPIAQYAYHQTLDDQNLTDLNVKAHFYLAAAYAEMNEQDSSLHHYLLLLNKVEGTKNEGWAPHIYKNITWFLIEKGEYEKAIDYFLKSLKIAERERDTLLIGVYTSQIGYCYDRLREFNKAISWQKKALPLFEQIKDSSLAGLTYTRIGIAYDGLEVYDSAHYYNGIALTYAEARKDSMDIGVILSNIGNTYRKQMKLEEALKASTKALQIKEQHDEKFSQGLTIMNIGKIYRAMGDFEKSKEFLQRGLRISQAENHLKYISEAFHGLYELYRDFDQYDSALHYYIAYDEIEDSLYSEKKKAQITNLEAKYENEKKERMIANQNIVLAEKEHELAIRQRMIFVLLAVVGLVLGIFAFVYQRYKNRKQQELQQLKIEQQEILLEAVIEAQEEERKRIAKDLHDGIGQQLSGLKMGTQKLSRALKSKDQELAREADELAKIISETAEDARSLSHQMMPRALMEVGLIDALEDMLAKSLKAGGISYQFEHFGLNERLPEKIEISLYRIAQELVNNIIKHSEATEVQLQLFKNKGALIMVVEDNGKGINVSQNTDGHGLLNIRSRLNSFKGEVNLSPSPNSGTLATVRLPIK